YGQAQFLFSNLELDVRGNHLLENIRALVWAGLAFNGAEPGHWFRRGMRLLEREVNEQVLSDGGHFERAPGYHVIVFRDLLEIALWLERNADGPPEWLNHALRRMGHYLRNIITPLGTVPLLKDTTWDGFFSPLELLNTCAVYLNDQTLKTSDQLGFYAGLLFGSGPAKSFREWPIEGRQSIDFPASRHYVVRDDAAGDYLVFDAGKPCPDYLPAHAHADSLSYELSVANQRIIVDSGVYEYTAGPWRDYFRSTRAHTTVEVEHENQSEVWSSFRVGSRARPGPSYWQSEDNLVLMQGEHDGYRRLVVPVIHQRTILAAPQRLWLVADQLWGNGQTNL